MNRGYVDSIKGTLGYIMSEVENGKPFSEAVLTAKELGYTEPDPRDDLSGMDVARKVESLYPDNMGKDEMSLEDFLEYGLAELDEDLDKRMKYAISNGKVLRYVCIFQGSRYFSRGHKIGESIRVIIVWVKMDRVGLT